MKRLLSLWPSAVLLLFILLFVWRALLPGQVLLPLDIVVQQWPPWQQPNQPAAVNNPLLTDVVDYIYPVKEFTAAAVKQGRLPLWNPYVLSGYPATYNTQAGLFYPLSLFYYLLPAPTAVDLVIVVQMALGGAFMFAYLRLLRLRRAAAVAGALLFIGNGMMLVWLEWQVVHAALIWLPLTLYFVERIAQNAGRVAPRRLYRDAVLGGMAFAVPWLGGHWNWTLYGALTTAVYAMWRWGPLCWCERRWRRPLLRAALLFFVVGVALSLVQVLPAFNYLRQGHRQPLSFGESLSFGVWRQAVVALVPNFFGNPADFNWWGHSNYNEITFYLGILPLFLVALALWLRRDAVTWFYAFWGGVGFLWALGTPLYGVLYVLPVFAGLLPSRAMMLPLFAAAVLAAVALDRLLQKSVPRPGALAKAVVSLLVALALAFLLYAFAYRARVEWDYLRPYAGWFFLSLVVSAALLLARLRGRLAPRPFAVLVIAWLMFDLWLFGRGYNTVAPLDWLYPPTETAAFLHAAPGPLRIATLPDGVAYPPNSFLAARLPSVSGYEPAVLQRYVDYMSAAEGGETIYFERKLMPLNGLASPLLDALSVTHVVTIRDWYDAAATADVTQTEIDAWRPLTAEPAAAQSFTVADAGLQRLDVALRTEGAPQGAVTLRVFTADGGMELANDSVDAAELTAGAWHSFFFAPFPSEWGRAFRATAEFTGSGGEVLLGVADGGDWAFATYYLPRPNLVHEAGKTRVYENAGALPRAFVVPAATVAQTADAALAAVVANGERLDEIVVLEPEGQRPPPNLGQAGAAPGTVAIVSYELNEVTLAADVAAPAFVVLADTYYPGWRAAVDGEAVPVYRANTIMRAVHVPAGEHTITLAFRPWDFLIGAAVSGLILLGCLLALLYWRR